MKSQDKGKRSAEDWVNVAREFGQKCQAIQHDKKLSMDQKLEKQGVLSKELSKEIQNDPHLKSEEKKTMIDSITGYMDDWTKMHDLIKDAYEKNGKKK